MQTPGTARTAANIVVANLISPLSDRATGGATEKELAAYAAGGGDAADHANLFGAAASAGAVAGNAIPVALERAAARMLPKAAESAIPVATSAVRRILSSAASGARINAAIGAGGTALFGDEEGERDLGAIARSAGRNALFGAALGGAMGGAFEAAGPVSRAATRVVSPIMERARAALQPVENAARTATPPVGSRARSVMEAARAALQRGASEAPRLKPTVEPQTPLGQPRPEEMDAFRAAQAAARIPRDQQTFNINTPERERMRSVIADLLYGTGSPTKDRKALIILGPPGAGKSTIAEPFAKKTGALLIDADAAKEYIPEYPTLGPAAVHEESSGIVENLLFQRALENGDNFVMPRVGRTTASVTAMLDDLQAQGYDTQVKMADLPLEKARERALQRWRDGDRFVNPDYISFVGNAPRQTFEAVKTHLGVSDYVRYSTDVPRGTPLEELPVLDRSPDIPGAIRPSGPGPGRRVSGERDPGNPEGGRGATGSGDRPQDAPADPALPGEVAPPPAGPDDDGVEYRHSVGGLLPKVIEQIKRSYRGALVTPYAGIEKEAPALVDALHTAGAAPAAATHVALRRTEWVMEGLSPVQEQLFGKQLVLDNLRAGARARGAGPNACDGRSPYRTPAWSSRCRAGESEAARGHSAEIPRRARSAAVSRLDEEGRPSAQASNSPSVEGVHDFDAGSQTSKTSPPSRTAVRTTAAPSSTDVGSSSNMLGSWVGGYNRKILQAPERSQ